LFSGYTATRVNTSYIGSKAARVLVLKFHINGKINTKMK